MTTKSEALQLAQDLESYPGDDEARSFAAAAELRRLHTENKLLHERHSYSNEILEQHEAVNQELLEALKEAEPMLQSMLNHIARHLPEFTKMPALDKVRAAIAKASTSN